MSVTSTEELNQLDYILGRPAGETSSASPSGNRTVACPTGGTPTQVRWRHRGVRLRAADYEHNLAEAERVAQVTIDAGAAQHQRQQAEIEALQKLPTKPSARWASPWRTKAMRGRTRRSASARIRVQEELDAYKRKTQAVAVGSAERHARQQRTINELERSQEQSQCSRAPHELSESKHARAPTLQSES
jgi:hypothetical protein